MSMKRAFQRAHELFLKARADLEKTNGGAAFQLYAKRGDTAGDLYIYDIIGEDWWADGGVTAAGVKKALADMGDVKTLNIYINSPGGDVFEAKAIFTQLQRSKAHKVVHIDGVAASAATFIAMAGDKIVTAEHANWMIHEASAMAFGRAEDMRAKADVLDIQNKDMAERYAARTKRPVDEIARMMADETWMSAAQALEYGFTDEVAPSPEKVPAPASAVATSPLVAAVLATERDLRAARQSRRIEQFNRASPEKRDGQPERK